MTKLFKMIETAGRFAEVALVGKPDAQLTAIYRLENGRDEVVLVSCPWTDEALKQSIILQVREIAAEHGAIRFCLIDEAWASFYPAGTDIGSLPDPPSQRPDRREIVIAVASDGVNTESVTWTIVRSADGVIERLDRDERENAIIPVAGCMVDGILPVGGHA